MTLGKALDRFDGRVPGFNFVRLCAAFAVLLSHSFDLTGNNAFEPFRWASGAQTSLGGTAVFIFFMISGFLVTSSFFRSRSLAAFAAKRVLRIFPALAVVVLLSALVLGPAVTTMPRSQYFSSQTFHAYFGNMFLVESLPLPGVFESNPARGTVNGSLWTLRYEVLCYALLAIAATAGAFKKRSLFAIVALVLFALGWWAKRRSVYLFAPLNIEIAEILRFVAYFSAGIFLYLFKDRIILDFRAALAALILSAIFLRFGFYHLFFPVLGGYLVAFVGMQPSLDIKALHHQDYSYGFYLYAFPVQQMAIALASSRQTWWVNVLVSVPFTLLFAILSWHLIERPALELKARIPRYAFSGT